MTKVGDVIDKLRELELSDLAEFESITGPGKPSVKVNCLLRMLSQELYYPSQVEHMRAGLESLRSPFEVARLDLLEERSQKNEVIGRQSWPESPFFQNQI